MPERRLVFARFPQAHEDWLNLQQLDTQASKKKGLQLSHSVKPVKVLFLGGPAWNLTCTSGLHTFLLPSFSPCLAKVVFFFGISPCVYFRVGLRIAHQSDIF